MNRRPFSAGVDAVLGTVLAIGLVALPWAVQQLLRIDPLHPRTGWIRRRGDCPRSAHPGLADPALRRAPLRQRGKVPLVATLAVVALAGITPVGRNLVDSLAGPDERASNPFRLIPRRPVAEPTSEHGAIPVLAEPVDPALAASAPGGPLAAHAGDAWWDSNDFNRALDYLLQPRVGWRPANPYRLLDLRSPYVNIVEGNRSSWVPPPCTCRRLTVWVYGGSTAFGLDQRDDHTIASELARVAAAQGVTLDVSNRGQLGQMHWEEAERLAWDLTREDAPDLVVFYDGVNERNATNVLNEGDPRDVKPVNDPMLSALWAQTGRSDGSPPPGPAGSKLVPNPTGPALDVAGLAQLTVDRYQRARQLSLATTARHRLPVRYYWQPSRFSRPVIPGEPHYDAKREDESRLTEQLTRAALPDDVTDLTDVFDGDTTAIFTDDVHHNERGARLVAEALFVDLEPQLRSLLSG